MKLKPSQGLNLVVMALTMFLATIPVFFVNGWHKWVICAAILAMGIVIENRIERACTATDKNKTK